MGILSVLFLPGIGQSHPTILSHCQPLLSQGWVVLPLLPSRGGVQGSTLTLPQLCLWLFSQTLHLPRACPLWPQSITTGTSGLLRTPAWRLCTELDPFLCSGILGSDIWETEGGVEWIWLRGKDSGGRVDKMVTWSASSEENRRI